MTGMMCPYCMKTVQEDTCPHCSHDVHYSGRPNHLPVGYTLSGQHPYVLGAAIGQGGFGITYIALDVEENQRVAVKEYFPTHCCGRSDVTSVYPNLDQEETFDKGKKRFLDEARMLKSLSDLPSVVNVLDFFEANNSAYLVMEYLDGDSLKDHVEKCGKLPAQQFLTQLKPLMTDMEKMHGRGVVHRDIAPDNIILLPDGRLKLIDFGAARSYVGDKSMTVVVKKGFAPVEQYMRKGSCSSTDVYALAATIYYCITGIIPPDSAERQYGEAELLAPTALGIEISHAQERILEKALEIQPKDRTQTIAELARALAQAPKPVPPKLEKPKPAPKKEKPPKTAAPDADQKKKPNRIIFAAAAVIALICAGAGVLLAGNDAADVSEAPEQMEAVQTLPPETEPVIRLSAEAQKYNEAVDFFKKGEYGKAAIAFGKLGDYRDARERSFQIWDAIAERKTIAAGHGYTLAVREDGTVASCGQYAPNVSELTNVVALSGGAWGTSVMALKSDGTVTKLTNWGDNTEIIQLDWTDVVSIEGGQYGARGLKADGSVLLSAETIEGRLKKIVQLHDVVKLTYSGNYAELADGTILVNFEAIDKQDIIDGWECGAGVALLNKDGTVTVKMAEDIRSESADWKDIVSIYTNSIYANSKQLFGIKSDGTVVACGDNSGARPLDVYKWTDVVDVVSSGDHSIGLKSDGTLVSAGNTGLRERQTYGMDNIRLPADREALLAAIKLDYITGSESITAPEISPKIDVVSDGSENILCTDWIDSVVGLSRKNIRSITFFDSLKTVPDDAKDASQTKNRTVFAWSERNGTAFDVYVAAEGTIIAPQNCLHMFSGLENMISIDFGDSFDTSAVTCMEQMFYRCSSLTSLDLSCFDTSSVTNMVKMFYHCKNLEELDVNHFDVSSVEKGMRREMFTGCPARRPLWYT